MAHRRKKRVPPPPRESDSDARKARYYAKHDPVDLLDAGYLVEEGIFQGDKRLVDLRPERGLVQVPIAAPVARKLHGLARRAGCTPSDLATRCQARELHVRLRR
jgi:hypothetical protein